jgi:hydroxymethylbilane synthase
MQEGRADLAVHSMKDVPADLPPGMIIAAVLERADPRDAFVSSRFDGIESLPQGARVGTASMRRQCQLRHRRPDLDIRPLRGNLDTRLRKLDEGEFDAIVLAAAGLRRLGLAGRIRATVDTSDSLPAVGQGVVGIECRVDDAVTRALLAPLEHAPTRLCLEAERAFAARLGGSCQSPIAAFAELNGTALTLRGLVGAPDGSRLFVDRIAGASRDGARLGRELAERLLATDAGPLLEQLRATPPH